MKKFPLILLVTVISLTACMPSIPKDALTLRPDTIALRQLQTRRFDDNDEKKLLAASIAVMQDLGFTLEESEVGLGVIVASKDRDATDGGQVAGKILLAVLFGANTPIDATQKIRVSLVTRPTENGATNVRVTFQRLVWNDRGELSRIESLEDPTIYQEFFEKLSKSVFLTANQI